MKYRKLLSAGLMSAVLLSSLITACSDKKEPTVDKRAEKNSVEETEETEEVETSETAKKYEDTTPQFDEEESLTDEDGREYGDDFVGKVKVSDETQDLYDDSDAIIKEGFVPSENYGYIFPYAATRVVNSVVNYDVYDAEADNTEFSIGGFPYDIGFCTADGTRITEPIYAGVQLITNYLSLFNDFADPYLYIVTDMNHKQALVTLDGKKSTEFIYDYIADGTDCHPDWFHCYQVDEEAQTTTITVYDSELNVVHDSIKLPFLLKGTYLDGSGEYFMSVMEFLGDKHVILSGGSTEISAQQPVRIYNYETNTEVGVGDHIVCSDNSVIILKDGKYYLSDLEGNPLTESYEYCLTYDNQRGLAIFSNQQDYGKVFVYDGNGELKTVTASDYEGIYESGNFYVSASSQKRTVLELYDKDKNYIRTADASLGYGESYDGYYWEIFIPDEDDPNSGYSYEATDCGDGFFEYEKGYVKEIQIGENIYQIFDMDFNPVAEVNGDFAIGISDGKILHGINTDQGFFDLDKGEYVEVEKTAEPIYGTKFGDGYEYQECRGIYDKTGAEILALRDYPYMMLKDPVTDKHYYIFSTSGINNGFWSGKDYDYMEETGFNRIFCVEDNAFIDLDFKKGYTDIIGIMDSHIMLSVNNVYVPDYVAAYSTHPFDTDTKGFYEIYDISDPEEPVLKFHYTEKDQAETSDYAQEDSAEG